MAEYDFDTPIGRGASGRRARLVQEWLCLQGSGVAIDSDFGKATAEAVKEFQARRGLQASGTVDRPTFDALVAPVRAALAPIAPGQGDLGAVVIAYARQHLAQSPREIGGQNRGPWVRLYMKGGEGADAPWCAGFVSFVLRQASVALGQPMPIPWTASCDLLAGSAKQRNRLVAEADAGGAQLKPGTIFLNRARPGDWDHTGIVAEFLAATFKTIEGNTNDAGDREGYEVCERIRGYPNKDFVRLSELNGPRGSRA